MPTIESIVGELNKELVPQFEERLRSFLTEQDREWLIDQIVRLTLDAHSLQEVDRRQAQERKARERCERISRLSEMELDAEALRAFLERYGYHDRETLIADGYLLAPRRQRGPNSSVTSIEQRRGTRSFGWPRTRYSACCSG
jgi:hypothetical protein